MISASIVHLHCVLWLTILYFFSFFLFLGDATSSHQGAEINNESIFLQCLSVAIFSSTALEHEAPLEGSHSSLVRALKNRLQVFRGVHAQDECEIDQEKLERRHNGQGSNAEDGKHLLLYGIV